MRLEGVITNVAAFGAFVDVGVHQDGLIHISCLSDRRVDDPRKVVKVGDIVKVRVLDVDVNRRRISLTMRTSDGRSHPLESKRDNGRLQPRSAPQGAMAAAFAKLHR